MRKNTSTSSTLSSIWSPIFASNSTPSTTSASWNGTRTEVQRLIIIAVMLVSGFASGQCAARSARPQAIGAVSGIQGEAIGTNGSATRPLGLNSSVFLNDVV